MPVTRKEIKFMKEIQNTLKNYILNSSHNFHNLVEFLYIPIYYEIRTENV